MNIVLNAIEAIETEGSIRVSARRGEGEIYVEVADSGRGIPEEDLPRIFDPGFTTKGAGVGSGLGLAITQRILSEHGGRVEAQSRPGEGATVRLTLPLATSAHAD